MLNGLRNTTIMNSITNMKSSNMKSSNVNSSGKRITVNQIMMILTVILFLVLFFVKGAGSFGDTHSYDNMGIEVAGEPGYPLLMALFRIIFGTEIYYSAIALFQALLTAFSTCFFVNFLIKKFTPAALFQVLMYAVMWAFYILPGVFSVTGVLTFLAMLTEGLSYPIFFIFLVFLLKGVMELSFKDWFIAIMINVLLILIRTQLFFALITAVVAGAYIFVKNIRADDSQSSGKAGGLKLALKMLGTLILGLLIIRIAVSVYTYGITGSYDPITTKSGFYANTMYLAEKEDANLFEDEFTRELFKERYRDIGEWGWGIRYYEGDSLIDAAMDVEEDHDNIKVHMSMGSYFDDNGITDPVTKFKMQNDMAGTFASKLFSAHLGRFLYNYLGMALVGLIRTVATAPASVLMQIYAFVIYLLLVVAIILNRKNRELFCLLWISLLGALINAFETAAVIMVISRYAVYMFPMIYISLLLAFSELLKKKADMRRKDD